jgi:hypothetical protein
MTVQFPELSLYAIAKQQISATSLGRAPSRLPLFPKKRKIEHDACWERMSDRKVVGCGRGVMGNGAARND